jgi:hypothetical protein
MNSIDNAPYTNTVYYFSEQIILYPIVASTLKNISHLYLKVKHINNASKLIFGIAEIWMAHILTFFVCVFNRYLFPFKFFDAGLGRVLRFLETHAPKITNQICALFNWSYECTLRVFKMTLDATSMPFKYVQLFYLKNKLLWQSIFNKLVDLLETRIEKHLITQKVTIEPLEKHVELFKTHKRRMVNEKEYCTCTVEKCIVLFMVVFHWLRIKFVEQMDAWKVTDLVCDNFVFKLLESHFRGKHFWTKLQEKLNNRFFLTKEKIDLYKEYLDVLTKQFTVQDGRSLENVHVIFLVLFSVNLET